MISIKPIKLLNFKPRLIVFNFMQIVYSLRLHFIADVRAFDILVGFDFKKEVKR